MHLRSVVRLALALGIVFLLGSLALWVWTGIGHAQSQTIFYVDANADDGLVAHWQFNQSGGTVTTDFRNLITATVSGAANPFTTTVVAPPLLRPNPRALSLNPGGNPAANDDYLTVNDTNPDLNRADGFTVAAWVRREANGDNDPIYDSGVQTGTWWIFIAGSDGGNDDKLGFGLHDIEHYYSTATIPADGQWHHIAVAVENGPNPTVRFYVNGVAAGAATINHEIPLPYGVKHIGAFSEPGETTPNAYFDGLIDELRFYKRALTPEEIERLGLSRRSCVTIGESWAQAFPDLHCALEVAAPNDQIWVAKGRYYPRVTSGSTDTFVTFNLKNSVAIYGNFNGDESSLDLRPSLTLTDVIQGKPASVLTADFRGNDDLTTFANTGDNLSTIVSSLAVNSASRLDGFVLQGARALDGGGAAVATAGGSPTYANLIFWANRGAQAMRNTNNSSPSLHNVIFYQNLENAAPAGHDGVLNNVASHPTLTDVQFISNTAHMGGAMVNDGGSVRLANVQFLGNTASNNGGAVALLNGSTLLGEQLTFRHNRASNGGALYLDGSSSATITDTHFLENRAGLSATIASLTQVTFTLNLTSGHGGALYAENGSALTVTHGTLDQNSAAGAGGALYALTGTVTLSDVIVRHNQAQTDAGGLYLHGGHSTLYRVQLVENTNGGMGGGALIAGGEAVLDRTLLHGNVAEGDGGGLAVREGASITATNLLLVGNAGEPANAIDVAGATMRLINSSLAGHNSPGAAGVRVAGSAIFTAANVIFWDSGAALVDDGAAAITELYNYWGGPDDGEDLRFARIPTPGDGDWRTPADNDYGDLHLRDDSPAIDAGDGALLPAGITADFDGAARIVDAAQANAASLPVDLGAFEMGGTSSVASLEDMDHIYYGSEGTPIDLAAGDIAAAEDGASLAWDCTDDGSFEVDGPDAVCTYPDDGTYTARLRMSEDNGNATEMTATVIITNVAPTVTAPAGQNATEGLPQNFSIGTLIDPGADAPWTVTIRWGDGQPDTTFTVEQPGPLPVQGHTFADDSERQGSFTVEVSATDKDGMTATVTFPISVANQPPVAADDRVTATPDTALLIDVLVNDADLPADPLTLTEVGAPAHGLAEVQGQQVRYSPPAGFQGTDVFTYTVSDDEGSTAGATVTVTVGSSEGE